MTPEEAFELAKYNPGEKNYFSYFFAEDVPEANIKYCQEHACKSIAYAYRFAKDIPEADIEYCYSYASHYGKKEIELFILNDL